jgi:hypothetical protein
MTIAICFNCGETKFGAFTMCKKCQARPSSESDFVTSLGLTDHYHSAGELEKIGLAIKKGQSIHFPPDQNEKLAAEVKDFLKTPIGKTLTGQPQIKQTKKWWIFWN